MQGKKKPQAPQLDGQIARCLAFATGAGLSVVETVTEVGSGLNGPRKKLLGLLADPKIDVIVGEHRDRLMRFGAEYVEAALAARGARLVVVDDGELTDDLVADLIARGRRDSGPPIVGSTVRTASMEWLSMVSGTARKNPISQGLMGWGGQR